MHPLLRYAKTHEREIVSLIGELVECESPSDDAASVNRFVSLVGERTRDITKSMKRHRAGGFGDHARGEFILPGAKKDGRILALAHSDTVWPLGTLRRMPLRRSRGRLYGPGVFDMKAGIVFFIFAVRALRELGIPVRRRVLLQINSDEEVGSPSSRSLTEEAALGSAAVLVLEPAQGLDGRLKTARKGVGDYRIRVQGRAAHAGVDFEAGASAVVELARQIDRIAGFTNLDRGITVNPGIVSGGTRTNVIAAEAYTEVDVRIATLKDARPLHRRFTRLRPFDKRCSIEVSGGLNRPPLERTPGNRRLWGEAQQAARELGFEVEEASTGGGSDGNFTSAMRIPTLDGLGAVGEGAHATNENIVIGRIAERVALLAALLARL
jgi:glutamate carboxypeptidase